jgi:hypothetical protein
MTHPTPHIAATFSRSIAAGMHPLPYLAPPSLSPKYSGGLGGLAPQLKAWLGGLAPQSGDVQGTAQTEKGATDGK